jgi:hypothetical protein
MSDSTEQKLHEFAEQLTYKQMDEVRPSYIDSIYQPLTGTDTITLTNSTQISRFELPTSEVFNLGRSTLRYTKYVAKTTDYYNNIYRDTIPEIQMIRLLMAENNTTIAQIDNLPEYFQTVLKYETKLEDFYTRSPEEILYKSDLASNSNERPNAAACSLEYVEPRYLVHDAKGTAGGAGQTYVETWLPLRHLKNTFFALDKDVCFAGKTVYLEITWNDKRALGWVTDADDTSTNRAEITGVANIQNLGLYLAMEQNEGIAASIKMTAASGMKILTDYVLFDGTDLTSTGRRNVQLRFSRTDGHTLKKVFHTIYNATATLNTRYDNSLGLSTNSTPQVNFQGMKTMWNNKDRQSGFLIQYPSGSAVTGATYKQNLDDWKIMKEYARGSVIQSYNQFLFNWCFCDDYSNIVSVMDKSSADKRIRQGQPLGDLARWDIVFNAGSATYSRHMSWAIVQRELFISKSGIAWI